MRANKYISRAEHKLILIVALLVFIFPISILSFKFIQDYNHGIYEAQQELKYQANGKIPLRFAVDSINHSVPIAYLLSVFIFIALLKPKKFLLSSFLTFCFVILIIYGIYFRFEHIFAESMFGKLNSGFIEQMQIVVYDFDYTVFALAIILLFWQISILLRMLVKTTQRKLELP